MKRAKLLITLFGILFCVMTVLGFLFKIQHWPFANALMIGGLIGIGMTILLFLYLLMKKSNQ
jgi:uncharacterized membrane protein HdeD (DUF308 family)